MWKTSLIPRKINQQYVAKFSLKDCIEAVQNFYDVHKRVPTINDIDILHAEGKSPGRKVFQKKGGLACVIEQTGLPHSPRKCRHFEPGELKKVLRTFVFDYIKNNDGRFPTATECTKGLSITTEMLRINTGLTCEEFLLQLGGPVRRGREANLPALEH